MPGGSSTRERGASQQYSQSGGDCAEASACVSTGGFIVDMTKRIVSLDEVREAYRRIRISEAPLVEALLTGLRRSNKVRVIEADKESLDCITRLPTVCFNHADIAARQIHALCEESGIACRRSSFLCTEYFARDFGFDYSEGILRVSLAHYNTLQEIDSLLHTLESIPGWY